jgi:hypothetical protein
VPFGPRIPYVPISPAKKPPDKGPKPVPWPGHKPGPKNPPPPKGPKGPWPEPPIWKPVPGIWPPDATPPQFPYPPDKAPEQKWPPKLFPSTPNSPLNDPLKVIEPQLGGVELAATGEFSGDLGTISGAVYDPDRQDLVLLGDEQTTGPSLRAEDLAIALRLVFSPDSQDPQFTLDPADPQNVRGEWLKAVYIPEQVLAGTAFGQAMFEADWLLKQYAFGVEIDSNGKVVERRTSVSGFKSEADLMYVEPGSGSGSESWARQWIVSDEMRLKQSGSSILFDAARMRVKAKKIVPDPPVPTSGGSTAYTRPSRPGERGTLSHGHSVVSLQRRRPTPGRRSERSRAAIEIDGSGHPTGPQVNYLNRDSLPLNPSYRFLDYRHHGTPPNHGHIIPLLNCPCLPQWKSELTILNILLDEASFRVRVGYGEVRSTVEPAWLCNRDCVVQINCVLSRG